MTPIDRAAQRLAFVRMHLGAQASEPVTASADEPAAAASPLPRAAMGDSLAVSFISLMLFGMGGIRPSGGLARLTSGMGSGIGNLVIGFWMPASMRSI